MLLFIGNEGLLIGLLPEPDAAIGTDRDEEITDGADRHGPHLSEEAVEDEHLVVSIAIDHFYLAVFRGCDGEMGVFDETNAGDGVLVDEHGLMNVTELHTPDF